MTKVHRPRMLILVMQSASWREIEAVKSLRTMFTDDPRLNVVVADARMPLTPGISTQRFDIIVLTSTFLGARYSVDLLNLVKNKFEFVATAHALKVAMPQDEYDCSWVLDNWLSEWSIDLIYSACPMNWSALYPINLHKADIRAGYTSYISDRQVIGINSLKPWSKRNIDVSYRATSQPLNFGHLGQLKQSLGNLFQTMVSDESEFVFDINTGNNTIIKGKKWLEFIESSRFVLASPSGSSFVDPKGDLRRLAVEPQFRNGNLSEFLVEATLRRLEWYELSNTAISPRNIEAALMGTVQIAIPGEYSGILQSREHYVPLDQSFDAGSVLRNEIDWLKLRSAARDAILSVKRLRANELVSDLLGLVSARSVEAAVSTGGRILRDSARWNSAKLFSKAMIPLIRKLATIYYNVARRGLSAIRHALDG